MTLEDLASYGAFPPAFPSGCCPSSMATSRVRSSGDSLSSAAARASTVSVGPDSCSLVQALVQAEGQGGVTSWPGNTLGCCGS